MVIKNALVIVGTWLLSAFLLVLFGGLMLDWPTYRSLAKVGIETTATVSAKEPANHRSLRYKFQVKGKLYEGIGRSGGINPDFDDLEVGDAVKIYYDPSEPERSYLGDPKDQLNSINNGLLFLGLVGSSMCMYGLYAKGWLPLSSPGR